MHSNIIVLRTSYYVALSKYNSQLYDHSMINKYYGKLNISNISMSFSTKFEFRYTPEDLFISFN